MAAMELDDDDDDAIHVDGISEALSKVRGWLKSRFAADQESEENDRKITLQQQWRNGEKKDIGDSFTYSFGMDVSALAEEIVETATEDCMELQAKSMKYHLSCEGMRYVCNFTLKCPQFDDEDIDDIEDPSKKGLLMQTMRHQETTFKLAITDRSEVMSMLKDENRELRERIKFLESKTIENMKAYEDLINGRHARDLEIKRFDNAETRKDMALSTLMAGAPIVISRLLGGGTAAAAMATSIPGGRTQLELLVEGFLKTLDGEQFEGIVKSGLFRPDQVGNLVEIAKFCMDRDEAEKKAASGKAEDTKHPAAQGPQVQVTQEQPQATNT